MAEKNWYYVKDNKPVGPISERAIQEMFKSGSLNKEILVWTQSLSDWIPASNIVSFQQKNTQYPLPLQIELKKPQTKLPGIKLLGICFLAFSVVIVCVMLGIFGSLSSNKASDDNFTGSDYKGNYVYGGAMNQAWNELNENILHEKLRLNTKDKIALGMVDKFNKAIFTKNDLDEASYYVKSGYGPKTVESINKEMQAKFPDKSFGNLTQQLRETDIIAYAYFLKKVEYVTTFEKKDVSFMGQRVNGFYAVNGTQKKNVKVLNYWDDDKFIVSLQLKDNNDELILAKGFDMGKPIDIVNKINQYNTHNISKMGEDDLFEMTKLHLNYSRDYKEIIDTRLANNGFESYCIAAMCENIKFDMDHKGARVENEASLPSIGIPKQGIPAKQKKFILDRPFWVVMKRKNSHNPYFILGVNNSELMEKRQETN